MRPLINDAKLAVTGGFRSVGPMNGALADGSTDFIGLGRPLCSEPYFCRDLLSGAITQAKENKVVRRSLSSRPAPPSRAIRR